MLRILTCALLCGSVLSATAGEKGWISLFDGESLKGWKEAGAARSFVVEDGKIVANGKPLGHLFYAGPVRNADFKNFELKLDVMTMPQANSGVYFHTKYQAEGWPKTGFEAQVNASHKDHRKSGGLYGIVDVNDVAPHVDKVWWKYHIIVKGPRVSIKINGKTTAEWTQPDDWKRKSSGQKIDRGTFALQAHDPDSVVYFKNIQVKPLD